MKILITGANGQLGKAFRNLFDKKNIEYLATDMDILDITDTNSIKSFIKKNNAITHIINCAAYNLVDKAEVEWEKAFKINGLGVRNLAIYANEIDAELIHYSTNYVFSGEKKRYTINDDPDPINKYGESKALGEKLLKIANKSYLIRTSWVFGDGAQNFLRKMINLSKKNFELKNSR